MDATIALIADKAVLRLRGRFDFDAHREYHEALERLLSHTSARAIEVDLGGVSYLDSSALGMLLVLRDRARRAGKEVTLCGASGRVWQVLDIANFSRLFTVR